MAVLMALALRYSLALSSPFFEKTELRTLDGRFLLRGPLSPDDLKEDLIHSLQKYVEVDEPEPDAVPMIASGNADSDDVDVPLDRMSEEDLLRGLEGLKPPEDTDDDDGL